MEGVTSSSVLLRELIAAHHDELEVALRKYAATNPRLFGSVARGDATADSDIDVLVDLDPADGNILFRAGGLSEEFRRILGRDVDVFSVDLLKRPVSAAAVVDAAAL